MEEEEDALFYPKETLLFLHLFCMQNTALERKKQQYLKLTNKPNHFLLKFLGVAGTQYVFIKMNEWMDICM